MQIDWKRKLSSRKLWAAVAGVRPCWTLVMGGTSNAGIPVSEPRPTIKVGDIVEFTGNCHYSSANGNTSFPCKPGRAKVTHTAQGKHPYHLVKVSGGGSSVFGWVDQGDVKREDWVL